MALLLSRLYPGTPLPRRARCSTRKRSGAHAPQHTLTCAALYAASGTFAPVAAYGLADDAFRVAAGGTVGRHLDASAARVRSATRLYALQHAAVALSAAFAAAAASFSAFLAAAAAALSGLGPAAEAAPAEADI